MKKSSLTLVWTERKNDGFIRNVDRGSDRIRVGVPVVLVDFEEIEREKDVEIRPITLREASDFINKYHRHHRSTVGHKFSVGLYENDILIGCAVCGRPVSRYLDDGLTCEINRVCTDGTQNACSMLYGAACRIAKEMGYKKIITYILESETGASLKASNFVCDGVAGGKHWTGKRNRGQAIPSEMKTRWSRVLKA